MISDGHASIDDVPGTFKTSLDQAFSKVESLFHTHVAV